MEFCDINVRVLYDFEYTTKYGRNIKISSGERLLLIKKTNDDWWQVIRSSEQRPFFVPATYVEEIGTTRNAANIYQSDTKCILDKSPLETNDNNGIVNTSISSDESKKKILFRSQQKNQETYLSHPDSSSCFKENYVVSDLKKDVSNTSPNKPIGQSNTMSSSGYNSLCEELPVFDEEDTISDVAKAIDIRDSSSKDTISGSSLIENKRHSKSYFDNILHDVCVEPPAFDNMLSLEGDNNLSTICSDTSENKEHVSNDKVNKYSTVINPTASVSEVSRLIILPDLPASESLENLSLQIELKTKSLRATSDNINSSVPMSSEDISGSLDHIVVKQNVLSSDSFNDIPKKESIKFSTNERTTDLSNNKCKESRSSEDVYCNSQLRLDNSHLQYKGSFKTITERQRWLKKGIVEQRLRNVHSCSEESKDLKPVTGLLENSCTYQETDKQNHEDFTPMNTTCTVASVEELRTCNKIDEILQQSECKAKVLKKTFPLFASDSQLTSCLKADSEKTTSRHSLDSVVESELRETRSEEFDHIKYKSKGLSPLLSNVLEVQKANSEKSSTDSLLDAENYGSFRKISGGTTSDSLVPTDGEDLLSSESETDSVKLAKRKQELKSIEHNAKKIPLARRRRVFSSKSRPELSLDPPSPETSQPPTRRLSEGWNEYDTTDGRKYFYNLQTKEKRWKPPRRNQLADLEVKDEHDSTEAAEGDDMFVVSLPLPKGWHSDLDTLTGQTCYVNTAGGARIQRRADYSGIGDRAIQFLLPFTCSYLCEAGFSSLVLEKQVSKQTFLCQKLYEVESKYNQTRHCKFNKLSLCCAIQANSYTLKRCIKF